MIEVGDNDSFLSYNTLPLSQQARKKLQGRAEKKKKNFSFLYNFFLLLCFPPLFNQNDTMKRILKAKANFSVVGTLKTFGTASPQNAPKLIIEEVRIEDENFYWVQNLT